MKTFKMILLLGLVFFAGGVVGVVVTRAVVRHMVREALMHPEKFQSAVENSLTRQLGLDAGQRAKLNQILSDTRTKLQDLRQQERPQFSVIFSNANEQINLMLTPEQQARFEKLKLEDHPLLQAIRQAR